MCRVYGLCPRELSQRNTLPLQCNLGRNPKCSKLLPNETRDGLLRCKGPSESHHEKLIYTTTSHFGVDRLRLLGFLTNIRNVNRYQESNYADINETLEH